MAHQATIAFALLSFGIAASFAQTICIPDPVGEIDLNAAGVLTWSASENCPETTYRVLIGVDGSRLFENIIRQPLLEVSSLPYCRYYNYSVTAISDHVLGMENYLVTPYELPGGTDIPIRNFRAAPVEDDLIIEWQTDHRFSYCISFYHLLIYDDQAEQPQSLTVTRPGYFKENVASCTNYRFEITSYYLTTNSTTQAFNFTVPEATNIPSLVEVRQDATTINTTWSLEKYHQNRCEVTALYVNGDRFNATYPIEDTRERPNVQVSISGLRANSMYYFNVSVENSAGVSEAVQLAVQTLPIDWS
ncbi:hypothetical protein NQ315_001392 [Exocentrus adspersus]|uniref:Fibronectin type III domain protein n=1 Tax=Exocentrus adspersus TaxID=1586481 RepID=A0AAV8WG51_9CUCU|nr:hypothetical protein NQ315_001392 [Exocentrus adspersus]